MCRFIQKQTQKIVKTVSRLGFRKPYKIEEETTLTLIPAGHIIGASFVQIKNKPSTLVFSGDLGRLNDPVMYPPAVMQAADYLVLESTYGNRLHNKANPLDELAILLIAL